MLWTACAPAPTQQAQDDPENAIPLLAYYYVWFDPLMWSRGKTDYPLLGRYSSDDRSVMRTHLQWAKVSGIDGFIVSWKSTEKLDRRLEQLMELAAEEGLKLAIIYQGLDFDREPLHTDQIARDLDHFIGSYAFHPVFDLFERPLVIWSGTWKFSAAEVAEVANSRREHLLILASEKNLGGYERLRNSVDGDAYYWSSVDPETYPGYPGKLQEMGNAVHADGGLWIAPAAPGFDARPVGGTRVVQRFQGQTLRFQMEGALRSSPDAIGLISWNEFSENTHVEPSQEHGARYLELIADMRLGAVPAILDFESSEPGETRPGTDPNRAIALGTVGLAIVVSLAVIARRPQGDESIS